MFRVLVKCQELLNSVSFEEETALGGSSFVASFLRIRNRLPVSRASHTQRHLCFQIRLVKNRKDLVAVECFKLCVQVLLVVRAVCVGVQTYSIQIVRVQVTKLHSIPTLHNVRWVQIQALLAVNALILDQLIVYAEISNRQAVEVQEELIWLWVAFQIKVDNSFAQVVAALVQGELEIVFKFGKEG